MTQKELTEALVDKLLQTIDPLEIADESLRQTIEILLNLVEQLNSQVKNLTEENQRLRDENNRLKGEQGVWVSLIEWYSSVRTLEYHSSHLCGPDEFLVGTILELVGVADRYKLPVAGIPHGSQD